MSDGEGYLEDIAYVPGFYGNLAPTAMRFAAALNGLMPPTIDDGFDYLELGCGTGLALALLAEANPEGRFVGVDFLAEHVTEGRRLAGIGGLGNLRFVQSAFGDLDADSLPKFDFITMHGVWAWVSATVRAEILAIVRRHLKPGGLVLVSYNAMPGWAPIRPIRDILYAHGARGDGAPLERVEAALDYLLLLRDRGAPYFKQNPAASDFVDAIVKLDRRYLAHEYFQDNWSPQAFSEVAEAFSSAGAAFVGSLPMHTNFRDLCAGAEFQEILASAPDRLILEVHKDLVANTAFRWDIYGTAPAAGAGDEPFAGFWFAAPDRPAQTFPFKAELGAVAVELAGGLYERLFAGVSGPTGMVFEDLARLPAADGVPVEELRRALGIMVATRLIEVRPRPGAPEVRGGPLTIPSAINRQLMAELPGAADEVSLASLASGTGHAIKHVDAAMLLDLVTHGRDGLPERIVAWTRATGRHMTREGEQLSDAEATALIAGHCTTLESVVLPRLRRRGIIQGG